MGYHILDSDSLGETSNCPIVLFSKYLFKMYPENVKEAMLFMRIDMMPSSMKHLKLTFLKLSLEMHPDKNSSTREATVMYQQLQQHYRVLGDYLVANQKKDDLEDSDEIEIFKAFNHAHENEKSFTIFLDTSTLQNWRSVLTGEYGPHEVPKDPNGKDIYGLMFRAYGFAVGEESCTIDHNHSIRKHK